MTFADNYDGCCMFKTAEQKKMEIIKRLMDHILLLNLRNGLKLPKK